MVLYPEEIMAELVIISGPDEGKTLVLAARCIIGRHKDCDFQVSDDTVSRHHAVITCQEDGYYIEDLGSSNGTFVNGKEVHRAKLAHRDAIKISHAVLSFREHVGPPETRVAIVDESEKRDSTLIAPEDAVSALMRDGTAVESVDELQDLHRKLLTVTRFSEAVRATLDLKALLNKAIGLLFEIFPQTERGFVMLFDEAGNLRPAASRSRFAESEITVSSTVLEVVLKERKAILSNNPIDDTRFPAGQSIVRLGMRSFMAAPLLSGEEVIGVMHIDTTRATGPFSRDDLTLFGGLADQAAVAVANARFHEYRLRRQRLEQELTIAQAVQKSFLPRKLPDDSRVEIACHYALAYKVGGDFYDVLELPGGRIGVSIGDVSGKGIPAALLMAKTISEMRASANSSETPANVLAMVNAMMAASITLEMFVTAVVCFYDPAAGKAVLADAGHNPPVVRRAGGVELVELEKGFPLGVVEEGQYVDSMFELGPGDTLLFYTDGVTDAENELGQNFGIDRLVQAVGAARPGARNTIEAILSAVHDFVGLTRPFDDLTMIAISPR